MNFTSGLQKASHSIEYFCLYMCVFLKEREVVGKTLLLTCGLGNLCLKGQKVAHLVLRHCLNLAGQHSVGLEEEEDPVLLEEVVEDSEVGVLI